MMDINRFGENSPLISKENVTFFYRGNAAEVFLVGDYNRWEKEDRLSPIENRSLWYIKKKFPKNARFDYKFVVDGNWITDPLNKNISQVGNSVNSTLIMPEYHSDYNHIVASDYQRGTVKRNLILKSRFMNTNMSYHLYLPPSAEKVKHILYALDGSDYLNYANINLVLDALIDNKQIPDLVAVFIDPDDRNTDYTIYEPYLRYVTDELMPFVESEYVSNPVSRSIIGVSWGGLTAFYLAFSKPKTFERILAQSGSYWPKEWQIFSIVSKAPAEALTICLQTGTIEDTEEMNDAMFELLKAKGYSASYVKYAETHSWSNWKGHLNEGLQCLFNH